LVVVDAVSVDVACTSQPVLVVQEVDVAQVMVTVEAPFMDCEQLVLVWQSVAMDDSHW